MLKAHFDGCESTLIQSSKIPGNSGHMVNRGTPREAFISKFLSEHLSKSLSVGTGEIIDSHSKPKETRNQIDIVIYRSDIPKIEFGGNISAFLAESVVATIEVKSLLTAQELATAIKSAAKIKSLSRNLVGGFSSGYCPGGILSFVVAYQGPAQMTTVHKWLKNSEGSSGLNQGILPTSRTNRASLVSEALDGVLCLGLGTILHDTSPISLFEEEELARDPSLRYQVLQQSTGNLLLLFLILTNAGLNVGSNWPNLTAYVKDEEWDLLGLP